MAPAILYSNEAVRAKPCSLWFHPALQVTLPELEGMARKPGKAADTTPADLAGIRSGDPGQLHMVLIKEEQGDLLTLSFFTKEEDAVDTNSIWEVEATATEARDDTSYLVLLLLLNFSFGFHTMLVPAEPTNHASLMIFGWRHV